MEEIFVKKFFPNFTSSQWFELVLICPVQIHTLEWVLVSQRANYTKQGINLKSWSSFSPFIFISTKSEALPAEKTTTVQYDLYDILISQSILFNRRNFIFSVLINRNINVDSFAFNPLNTSPTKWSDIRKQFVEKILRIVWLCLTICGVVSQKVKPMKFCCR